MHLAKAVGGNMLLGFLAAVAFATILAVVSGWRWPARRRSPMTSTPGSSEGQATEAARIRVSKIATICLGFVAIVPRHPLREAEHRVHGRSGLRRRGCANFPVLILSMYWKGLTTRSACRRLRRPGVGVAFVSSRSRCGSTCSGKGRRCSPTTQPALFAMPIAFILAYIFSKTDSSVRSCQRRRSRLSKTSTFAPRPVGGAAASSH